MARVPEVVYEKLNPEQQRVYKEVAGPRLVFAALSPSISAILNWLMR